MIIKREYRIRVSSFVLIIYGNKKKKKKKNINFNCIYLSLLLVIMNIYSFQPNFHSTIQ